MRIRKLAALIERSKFCTWVNVEAGGVYISDGHAIYKADNIPQTEDETTIGAILDLKEKTVAREGVITVRSAATSRNIIGLDLSSYVDGERDADRGKLAVTWGSGGATYDTVISGTDIFFFDKRLLGPLSDVIKSEEEYIRFYTAPIGQSKDRAILVRNGVETLAAIFPEKVITKDYMSELQDFWNMCLDQYRRQTMEKELEEKEEQDD